MWSLFVYRTVGTAFGLCGPIGTGKFRGRLVPGSLEALEPMNCNQSLACTVLGAFVD
jgi:hypothetical protein